MQNSQFFTTTWINMQDAYFSEKGNVGDWVVIGYSGPGTKVTGSSYQSNTFNYSGNGSCGGSTPCEWEAMAKTKLNDCEIGHGWKMKATATNETASGSGVYTAFVLDDNTSDSDCKALTAAWDNLMGSH
ncbi:MAG: hypothetical protein II819_04635 [Fibrobacter sp.]|nr:hypothetical protein [Fibrobacter sp.]